MGLIGEVILPVEVDMKKLPNREIIRPSFSDIIKSKAQGYKQFFLKSVKAMVEETPEDLILRKIYLSILKFFYEDEGSFFTVDSYKKWRSSCGGEDLSSIEEMRSFFKDKGFDLNIPSFYFDTLERRSLEV